MDDRTKKNINRQLISQADAILNQAGNELIVSLLSTCNALVKVTAAEDTDTVSNVSQEDIDRLISGYYSLSVNLKNVIDRLSSDVMGKSLSQAGKELGAASEMVTKKNSERIEISEQIEKERNHIREIEKEIQELVDEKKKQQKMLQGSLSKKAELTNDINKLKDELVESEKACSEFENNRISVMSQLNNINSQYEELKAAHPEYIFIRDGIIEEGYVNEKDFLQKTNDMNKKAEELVNNYETLLSNVIKDDDAIRESIKAAQDTNGRTHKTTPK